VNIPAGVAGDGSPTGLVYNASGDFVVSDDSGRSGPAVFIFAGELMLHGGIAAVDSNNAILVRRRRRRLHLQGHRARRQRHREPYLHDRFHNRSVDV
jgi:hypothetical protein